MNNLQTPSYQQPTTPDMEIPPGIKRVGKIIASLIGGALGGSELYVTFKSFRALFGNLDGRAVCFFPCVLVGVVSAAISEAVVLTTDIALFILGKREDNESLAHPKSASPVNFLRQRSWKVIGLIEKVPHAVDVVFSHLLGIRTAREIQEKKPPYGELYFMEIVRRSFWKQVHETVMTAIPQRLGISIVEACGYTLLSGHLFIWLHALKFMLGNVSSNPFENHSLPKNSGLIFRILRVYKKREREEELEKLQQCELENKRYCHILAEAYPNEIAELESREKITECYQQRAPENVCYYDILNAHLF